MDRYNPNIHHRRSVRLREYDYSQAGLYFVTICVKNKECVFGDIANGEMMLNEYGKMVNNCWLSIPQHYPYTVLHEFVVMPNHVHGILEIMPNGVGANNYSPILKGNIVERANNYSPLQERPHGTSRTIGAIIRGFKIGVTKQIGYSVWQRNYHEHIIRDCNRHATIVDYINDNPARWENDRFYVNF